MKTGDIVRLKSGGPHMTVSGIKILGNGRTRVSCIWFENSVCHRGDFYEDLLSEAGLTEETIPKQVLFG